MRGDIVLYRVLVGVGRQLQQLADARFDAFSWPEGRHSFGPSRANLQIFDGPGLAKPPAEPLDIGDQTLVMMAFSFGQQLGERAPHQFLLGAAFKRLEPRHNAGLRRERRQKRLREGVDSLDLEAARAVQHASEQLPRALPQLGSVGLAKVDQVLPELGILQSHPGRQPRPMRLAISAAAALVKVRHGSILAAPPCSSRRNTRAVSTCVFPVPAEAESAA